VADAQTKAILIIYRSLQAQASVLSYIDILQSLRLICGCMIPLGPAAEATTEGNTGGCSPNFASRDGPTGEHPMTFNQAKVIIVGAVTTEMIAAMERARQGIPVPLIEGSVRPDLRAVRRAFASALVNPHHGHNARPAAAPEAQAHWKL
jgi:hypothetical protein